MPMPTLRASAGEAKRTATPSTRTSPPSGWTAPARIFMSVDLPAPFSPTTAWTMPGAMARSTPVRAWIPPYASRRSTTSTAGGGVGIDGWVIATSADPLLRFVGDGLDVRRPIRDLPVDERLVVLACLRGRGRQRFELAEGQRRQVERLLHAVGRHDLRAGVEEPALRQVHGRGLADGVGQDLDRQVALHEGGLAEADVGVARLDLGEVLGGQAIAAADERRRGVGRLQLAEAGDVRRAQADEGLGVRVGREERLPGGVVLVGRDLDVEWAEDLEPGGGLQRFLDAPRPVLEHREAREAVADDDRAGGTRAAQLLDDLLAEDASALDGTLADVRRLDRGHEQVELHDRGAAVDDLVERARHRLAGDGRRDPLDASGDEGLDGLELGVGVTSLGTRDLEVDIEVLRRGIRAVDDLLDERVAQDVGDEPELDRLGRG